jgi:hypothetical protein
VSDGIIKPRRVVFPLFETVSTTPIGWQMEEVVGVSIVNPRGVSVLPVTEEMRESLAAKAEAAGLTILEYLNQQFPPEEDADAVQ